MLTKEQIVKVLETVIDPELGIDVWTLGLIYGIEIKQDEVKITMTFTTPACPYGPQLIEQIGTKLEPKAGRVRIQITYDPPWMPSEDLKEILGVGLGVYEH